MIRFSKLGIALVSLVVSVNSPLHAGWDANAEKKAEETIARFKDTDPELLEFFNKAYGYAVFPTVGKAGMGIGGARGEGIVYEQGQAVGSSTLTQVTIGFQFGGQTYSEIIFFKSDDALKVFKEGNYELSAQASAVALTKGASADADYNEGVAVFTMTKTGAMFEASVGGQKLSFEPMSE